MSFVVEFCVEIPPLARASRTVPEMRVSGEDIVLEGDRPHKFVFSAHGTRFDEFEAGLESDPTVAEYTVLTRVAETCYYVVTYDDSARTVGTYHVAVEQDIAYVDIRLQDGEYFVRAFVPDRAALAALREHCRGNDIPFRLERIYREEGTEGKGNALTGAQREALELAYERGYFDIPRETTLDALGDELGVSRQAVADRLRRGHRRLLEATIV